MSLPLALANGYKTILNGFSQTSSQYLYLSMCIPYILTTNFYGIYDQKLIFNTTQ